MGGLRAHLYLSRLKHISPEVAGALASCEGYLCLDGLTELTTPVANALSRHSGGFSFGGIKELSESAAVALKSGGDGPLVMRGIETLGKVQAESIARYSLGNLSGMETVIFGNARLPRVQAFNTIDLLGLKTLTKEEAAGLAVHYGDLQINGLEDLNPEAAKAFLPHEGGLFLRGLGPLSVELAEALSYKCARLYLPHRELSTEAARALATHLGCLFLLELNNPRDSVAEALAAHEGLALFLESIGCLSVKAAEAFGKYSGEYLSLGLHSLPLPQAQALACFEGDVLDFNDLEIDSEQVREALKNCTAKVLYASGTQL